MSFVDRLLTKQWKWGDEPPPWIMKEFDTFPFDLAGVAPTSEAGNLADKIGKVLLQQEFPEMQVRLQQKDSE
jgi:hypothetical protein